MYASVFAQIILTLHAIGILARSLAQPVNPIALSNNTPAPENLQPIFDSYFTSKPSGMGI